MFGWSWGRDSRSAVGDGLINDGTDMGYLIDSHESVDFGEQFWEFVAKALGHASGNNDGLTAVIGIADGGRFEDGIDGFLLGGVDEGAGIDDDGVGVGGFVGDFEALLEEGAEHDFGINQIFRATEGHNANAARGGHLWRIAHK